MTTRSVAAVPQPPRTLAIGHSVRARSSGAAQFRRAAKISSGVSPKRRPKRPLLVLSRTNPNNGAPCRGGSGGELAAKELAASDFSSWSSRDADRRNSGSSSLPTVKDIAAAAARQGLKLETESFGPSFKVTASSLDGKKVYGGVEGWITVWTKGRILHLEAAKLERGASKQVGNVFGAGLFVGASSLRFGLDRGCRTAELMAIYDDEHTHAKLVKYYSRLGFKAMYDVDGEDWKYFWDRVVWGGLGTRMDADCEELLRRWSPVLKTTSNSSQMPQS